MTCLAQVAQSAALLDKNTDSRVVDLEHVDQTEAGRLVVLVDVSHDTVCVIAELSVLRFFFSGF